MRFHPIALAALACLGGPSAQFRGPGWSLDLHPIAQTSRLWRVAREH